MPTLTLRPRCITRSLAIAVLVMAGASVVAQWVRHVSRSEDVRAVARIFKLSAEDTIPAFYSAVTLLASAGLFWLIARMAAARNEAYVRHWRGLAIIFTYMSTDEAVGIHELTIEPMRRLLGAHATGVLHYAWVLPGLGVVLVVGLTYLRFVLQLPPRVRNRILIAATLYVGGAVGLEMVGGVIAERAGTSTIAYAFASWLEECCEMFGIVILIDALLIQLAAYGEFRVALADASPSPAPEPTLSRSPHPQYRAV